MKTLAFIIGGVLLLLVVGVMITWQKMYPTYTYRYKLIVEIDTPEGIKSGSSVVDVKTIQYPHWMTLGNNSESTSFKGEATVVDLGEHGLLFTLLDTDSAVLTPRAFLKVNFYNPPLARYALSITDQQHMPLRNAI